MRFEYQDLAAKKPVIDRLELQSFEMNVYLVQLTMGEDSGILFDLGRPMRFHSTQQVRDAFEDFRVKQSVMIHHSPYDEMIGNPPKVEEPMEVPFSLQQPY